MDFFAMLLEGWLNKFTEKFAFIKSPVIRGIVQILVAVAICLLIIGIFFVIADIIVLLGND